MGVDWSSKLLVGVPLMQVYTEEDIVKNISRYDTESGQPYLVAAQMLKRKFLRVELPDIPYKQERYCARPKVTRNWDFLPAKELGVFFSFYDEYDTSYLRTGVVGKAFVKHTANDHNWITSASISAIQSISEEVWESLKKFGYNGLPPQVFNMLCVSY